ncbi:cystatin-SA-like [Schistocerca piceifrons]|uniref:cystatin-SA-like n=1 Tax=Schistocerca piceifrons TaxID=274613 RepID=UPI001F5FF3E8|nr:cystatin-SA-like [Schistocerca piceifrons]
MKLVYFLALLSLCISLNAHPVSEPTEVPPPGGLEDADVNDEAVKNAAAFAVSEIDKQQDSEHKLVLVEIISAQTQIVSGTIYYLELEIGESNCTKGNDVATTECIVQQNSNNQICSVQVLEVQWENILEASNINCVPKSESQKKKS